MDKYIHDEKNGLWYERLLLFFSIISHRAAIVTQFQNPGAPTIPVTDMRASFFRAKQYPAERNFTRFPSGGVSQL